MFCASLLLSALSLENFLENQNKWKSSRTRLVSVGVRMSDDEDLTQQPSHSNKGTAFVTRKRGVCTYQKPSLNVRMTATDSSVRASLPTSIRYLTEEDGELLFSV